MPYLIAPSIVRCREVHPKLVVDAREDFRSELLNGVVEGELDLAVVPLPLKDHRVAIELLHTEPLLLVVGRNHPIAARTEINIKDLEHETFVSLGDSSALAAQIRSFFGDQKFQPRIGFRCAQVATLKLFVSEGLGISILPQLARLPDDSGSLTYLRLTGTMPTRELVIVRHLQRYQSRGAEQFLALLREEVARRGADAPAPP